MNWIELPLETRHHAASLDASKTISKPMVRLAQTMSLSCLDTNTISKQDQNEIPDDPTRLGFTSGAFKTISEPVVCLAQSVHLSCIKISKITFHMTQVA
jgi:hypothetical protein